MSKFKISCTILKFWTKNFGTFWAVILKNYCHIRNQHSGICQNAKFLVKQKKNKFGTKTCVNWVVLSFYFENLCRISKQHSRIYRISKFHSKIKIIKSWTKIALLGYFMLWFWKSIVIFEITVSVLITVS